MNQAFWEMDVIDLQKHRAVILDYEHSGICSNRIAYYSSSALHLMQAVSSDMRESAITLWEAYGCLIYDDLLIDEEFNENYGARMKADDWSLQDLVELLDTLIERRVDEIKAADEDVESIQGEWSWLIDQVNQTFLNEESWVSLPVEGYFPKFFRGFFEYELPQAAASLMNGARRQMDPQVPMHTPLFADADWIGRLALIANLGEYDWDRLPRALAKEIKKILDNYTTYSG